MFSEAELESLLGWFWTLGLMFDTPAVIFSYGTHVWIPITVFIIPCSKEFMLIYSTHAVTADSQLHVPATCLNLMTHRDVKKNKWCLVVCRVISQVGLVLLEWAGLESWLRFALADSLRLIKLRVVFFVSLFIKSRLGSDWGAAACYKTQQQACWAQRKAD